MAVTQNYVLGQGKLFLDRFQYTNGQYVIGNNTGEVFVGECSDFALSVSSESKQLYSNTAAVKTKLKDKVTQIDYAASFTTQNMNSDNIAKALLGSVSPIATTVATVTDSAVLETNYGGVVTDGVYQIGKTLANPTGVRNLDQLVSGTTNVTVKTVAPAVTLTEGTDYTVDMALGRITSLNTAAILGKQLTVSYKTKVASRTQIITTNNVFQGSLKYIADNSEGSNNDIWLPYIILKPKGDISLIGTDWAQVGFDVNVCNPSVANLPYAMAYVDGRAA